MSADLICPGVKPGFSAFSRIAEPAMCGDDIEVPAMAWKYSPGGPRLGTAGVGVCPARIWAPGAVMSGLMKFPPGPREEKLVMVSPVPMTLTPWVKVAFTPGWAAMN